MATKKSNVEIMNAIRADLPPRWQDRIPQLSQENYVKWGMALATDDYTIERNEFLNMLIQKIAKTVIISANITNRLAFMKTGEFSLGDTIEEIFVGLITAETYDPTGEPDQFEKFIPNVDSMFHRRNREDYYPTTIQEPTMRKAFYTEGGLSNLINQIVSALYKSNDLDEYIYSKQMFVQYRYQLPTGVTLQPGQLRPTPRPVDNTTGGEFYKVVKDVVQKLGFPKTLYNPKGVVQQNTPGELHMFLLADLTPSLEVDVLTRAFNQGQLTDGKYTGQTPAVHLVDDFGSEFDGNNNDDVLAIICDKRTFQIYQNLMTLRTAVNARGLYENYFLHVWETYAASYFMNCVFITEETG